MKDSYLRYYNKINDSHIRIPIKAAFVDNIMAYIETLQGDLKLDTKKRYTYLDPITGELARSVFTKPSPKKAARSIFVKILGTIDDPDASTNLTIVNIDTEKRYYYVCSAVKSEKKKRVSEDKVITQRYTINISSVNAEFVSKINGD